MMNNYENDPLYQEILENCDGDEILAIENYEEITNTYDDE